MPDITCPYRVVFSVTNCICYDQRVQKIAEVVSNLGCDITIIGRKSGECCENNKVPFRAVRFRMLFKKGFLFYKFYNLRLFFYLLFHRYDLLVANDLDTLLPDFIVSKLKGIPLVYDSHEYFTGVAEIQNRPLVKWVWKTIEETIFPHLKYVMTVSDSIAGQYENEYCIRPVTVRNCSRLSERIAAYSREELNIDRDHLLLILQGTGINIDRGGEELIEGVKNTEMITLLVIGSGDVLPYLKSRTDELNISDRVKFMPKMPWTELMRYTKSADAGLSLDKDTNQNYRFSLPNKLFDYISGGIPVIAGNLPEVAGIIKKYNCGLIITEITPGAIGNAINMLKNNSDLMDRLKKNAVIASDDLSWEKESEKVTKFYENVLEKITAGQQDVKIESHY